MPIDRISCQLRTYIYMNDVIFMIVDIYDAAGTRRSCQRLALAASWQNMILRYMRHVLFLLLIILAMCFCLQKMPREIVTNQAMSCWEVLRYYRRNYSTPVTPAGWTSNALNANSAQQQKPKLRSISQTSPRRKLNTVLILLSPCLSLIASSDLPTRASYPPSHIDCRFSSTRNKGNVGGVWREGKGNKSMKEMEGRIRKVLRNTEKERGKERKGMGWWDRECREKEGGRRVLRGGREWDGGIGNVEKRREGLHDVPFAEPPMVSGYTKPLILLPSESVWVSLSRTMEKTTIERDAEKQESVEEREKEGKTRTVRRQQRRLTCPEPYFLSEGLYATPEELENTREIILHVITIGAFIEDSTKLCGIWDIPNTLTKTSICQQEQLMMFFLLLESSDEEAEER
ncbi:hypothetical protein ALC57_10325 [Trachymyrmex cornetzi]|uniref:Uncharacterized protein n=1 Tax=Trachymyrmex cornetzi TaxID=471704 RepID=A0A195DXK8_9HYME|nr:hypothetical protein ALC57_10325 [Trachymyrmex cornetzi]